MLQVHSSLDVQVAMSMLVKPRLPLLAVHSHGLRLALALLLLRAVTCSARLTTSIKSLLEVGYCL